MHTILRFSIYLVKQYILHFYLDFHADSPLAHDEVLAAGKQGEYFGRCVI